MRNKLILVFLPILLFCFSVNLNASHALGGELTWQCAGNGMYRFTFSFYRDCGGIAAPANVTIQNNAGVNIVCANGTVQDITPKCGGANELDDCSAVPAPPQGSGAVEEWTYTSGLVTLPTTPPPPGGWFFYASINARPANVNLQTGGNIVVRCFMYPYTPNGATAPLPAMPCYDNSPRFVASPTSIICSDYKFSYNHLAGDVELDSLSYSWAYPQAVINVNGTFLPGFDFNAPFPDQTENAANGPVTLDAVTGQMTVESYSPTAGNYIACVKVEAWKDCQLKASIFRDLALVFNTSPDCLGNNPPTANIDLAASPGIQQIGDNYYTSVYPGDTVVFDLLASDPDLNGFQFQQISLEVNNDEIGSPFSSQTGCRSGKTPCATLTPIAPQTSYTNPIQNEVSFLWVPNCDHLSTSSGCKGFTSTYPFVLRMLDNGCPANAVSVITVIVDVLRGNPNTPPFHCVNVLDTLSNVELSWSKPVLDSGLFFNYYLVYADSGNGNFGPVDTIVDSNQTITTITPGQMPSGMTVPGSYYMVMSMSSRAGCEFFSVPSDTLSPIVVTLTQPAGSTGDTLSLNWTGLHGSSIPSNYEIWVEVPEGSDNWQLYDQTTSTFFNGNLQVCDDAAVFEIRVLDPVTNCYSTSLISNAGQFTDNGNADVIVIDSVTVDPITGLANISWQPSTSPDVDTYMILFNDPNTGWTVIDSVPVGTVMPYAWANSQATSRAEEFRVISRDTCLNLSNDQAVISHKTMFMRDYLNKCEGYLRLSWSTYKGFPGGVGAYRLYYVETDANGITGPITLAFTGEAGDTTYRLNSLNSGSTYCFIVNASDTNNIATSSSNAICVNASVSQASRELYLANVTNNPNRGSIDLYTFIDGTADVSIFQIERSLDRFGPWVPIAEIGKPTAPPYVIQFNDFGADPDRSYFYRLMSTDSCGGIDTVSNLGRNLVVSARSNPNLTNTVYWTPYERWDGEVGRYDIYRSTDQGASFSLVGTNTGLDTTFDDNIAAFANDRIKFCYYVEAVETNNPLNYVDADGQPFSSQSNSTCLSQRVKMFMPNAFRPESSVEENRTFGPSLRFDDINRYQLLVMDRWGSKVFETNDPSERWDGTRDGQNVPSGVYVYRVKYATEGDQQQEESGSFTLIR
jgi:gliding motility-associated-like protein